MLKHSDKAGCAPIIGAAQRTHPTIQAVGVQSAGTSASIAAAIACRDSRCLRLLGDDTGDAARVRSLSPRLPWWLCVPLEARGSPCHCNTAVGRNAAEEGQVLQLHVLCMLQKQHLYISWICCCAWEHCA
jgi:hypothetical protein